MSFLGSITGQVRLDIRQAVASYAALRAQNARTVYAMRGTSESFMMAGRQMATAGAVMTYAFGKVVMAAAEYERKMDYFGAVTGATEKQMQRLSEFNMELAKTTIFSAGEIADGVVELGKAGVTTNKIINGIGEAMTDLAAAGDISLFDSGQVVTSTLAQFDLKANKAVEVVDLLAGAANASILDITDIAYSLKYAGGVAGAAGLEFEDLTTAISILGEAGIRGSTAGTSLRQMIVSFGGATGPAREALREIGVLTGKNNNAFYDAQGSLKPLNRVYQILQDRLEGYSNKQRLGYLRTIFNNRALSAAAILTRDGAKGFREMNAAMSKVTAADVATKRLDNLSGSIDILKSNIETLMIESGQPFQDTIKGWVDQLTLLVQKFGELDDSTQKNITSGVGITGALLLVLGVFNLIIGVIAGFIANLMKMGAAVKFVIRLAKRIGGILIKAFKVGPIGAVVTALTLGWQAAKKLYEHFEPFRKLVDWGWDKIVEDLEQTKEVMKKLGEVLVDAKDKAADFYTEMAAAVAFKVAPALNKLEDVKNKVQEVKDDSVSNFEKMKDSLLENLSEMADGAEARFEGLKIAIGSIMNPRAIGFIIGRTVGLFVRGLAALPRLSMEIARTVGVRMRAGFEVARIMITTKIAQLAAGAASRLVQFKNRAVNIFESLKVALPAVIRALPGLIRNIFARLVAWATVKVLQLRREVPQKFRELRTSAVQAIQALPGAIRAVFARMASQALTRLATFVADVKAKFTAIKLTIEVTLRELPGVVAGAVSGMVAAFVSKIGEAYNAAKSFAGGLWDGFKDGIGMNSPSHFSRAMDTINESVKQGTRDLQSKTLNLQRMSRQMAATQFGVGSDGSLERLAALANDRASSSLRARTNLSASLASRSANESVRRRDRSTGTARLVKGELDLAPSGRAFIRGVAQDTYDDSDYYEDSLGRLG